MDAQKRARCQESTPSIHTPGAMLMTAEAFRAASEAPLLPYAPPKSEDRVGLFWRICGGTVLSILALICIAAYQQLAGGISELRGALNHLNETNGDLVKKDELNTRTSTIWSGIKDINTATGAINGMRERSLLLEQQVKAGEEERKELAREVKRLGERLAAVEGRQNTPPARARPVPERVEGSVD